jgi:ABC-type sugar transport system ATPase subunit
MSVQPQPLLQVEQLSMLYGGVAALNDVTFEVKAGEVHGILGEAGAGKTTLMKILGGYIPAGKFTGQITLAGQPLALRSIRDGLQHRVALVPRLLAVFDHMSVADNATMASGEMKRGFSLTPRRAAEQAAELFHRWDIHLNPGAPVAGLSPLQRRQLMIANALGVEPLLVVLDEPLAGMPDGGAISGVVRLIRRMAERGVACLCLAMRPVDATLVADRISVLRDGALAGQWLRQDFDESVLAAAMASQRAYDPDARQRHDDFAPRRGMFDHWFKGPRNPN